jgi:iduronate 2-sulfatase
MRRILAVLVAAVFGVGLARAAERPNVLLICVDDLKPVLGCYGDKLAKSPNIDALAARGVRFDAAYCNQAVCSPSRNALLVGLRPQTLGIYDLATNFRKAAPDAVTLPQFFKEHGYRTEGMGKIFHTGHGNVEDEKSWSVPFWKANVVSYASKEANDKKKQTREAALFANVPGAEANKLPKGPAYESADVPDDTYPDGKMAAEAVKRIEAAAKTPDEPFFLAVGFMKPHLPFCAPKKYWDLHDPAKFKLAELTKPPKGAPPYAPTSWGELRNYEGMPEKGPLPDETARTLIHGYYAATSYMDAQVGRVLQALDKGGLAKNTIIVFWGDHGWHLGDHGMWCKHTNYEQATRIPLIIVDPRAKTGGAHSAALVESVDLYPTLCKLAGLNVPKGLEGESFANVVKQPAAETKKAVFNVYPRGKLIGRAVRTNRYRLVEWKEPGAARDTAVYELYDYRSDPSESKNLADDYPDAVNELRTILDKQPEAKPQLKVEGAKAAAGKRKKQQAKPVGAAALRPKNIVTRKQWGSKPGPIPESRKHTPQWITIHHAGVLWKNDVEPAQFVRNMQAWGKRRPEVEKPPRNTYWPDLAYHYMIAPNGDIYEARPVEYEPESNTKYELAGNLGIEMMGDFGKQRPSKAQLESVVRLTAWLMAEHGIDFEHVRTHRDAAKGQTSCPGRDFYRYMEDGQFRKWVNRARTGRTLNIDPGPPLTDPPGPTQLITDTRAEKKQS